VLADLCLTGVLADLCLTGVLADLCLTGVLADLCLTLYILVSGKITVSLIIFMGSFFC
jgi:hypothetical protein